ncbi:MAG: glycosyltransferase family 10 domain-containing protein [Coraliomargarita sp.]
MKEVRIHFCDFPSGFAPENNHFFHVLSRKWKVVLDPDNPDYLIYSCYGRKYLNYDCIRIFYTGENLRPDFNFCDYAIGFDYLEYEGRYLRYPEFCLNQEVFSRLLRSESLEADLLCERKFCNYIYSNGRADPVRDQFFDLLSQYKYVESLGNHLNNTANAVGPRDGNDWVESKLRTQGDYKFSIAFENSSSAGYTTEKIAHAFSSRTIPIYWGNPKVTDDLNPDAFINAHDYQSMEQVVQVVRRLDQDDAAYAKVLNASPFVGNRVPYHLEPNRLCEFFDMILQQSPADARRRPKYGYILFYEERLRSLKHVRPKVKRSPLAKLKRSLRKRFSA